MSKIEVNLDLVRKYNIPGPRYTSYPPATCFKEEVPQPQLLEKIRASNQSPRDLSVYVHLPFCQTLCWYCGCTTVITTQQNQSAVYLRYLERELDLIRPWLHPKGKVVQLHLGGGTPTFLLPPELKRLAELIQSRFELAGDLEASVEMDPRRLSRDHLSALAEAGFNRASLGVQDHNMTVQKAVHRIQPFALTKMVVEWIRAAGFKSLNCDLIYGLPFQTLESFARTLEETLALKPDRLAVYSYAHVPWIKPAQAIFKPDTLPSAELKLQLLKLTIEKLTAAGLIYIGMDHFARPDDEMAVAQREKRLQRNFQGYSTRAGADIYGLGLSSISQADGLYWQNHKDLPLYYERLDQGQHPFAKTCFLSTEDRIRRETIMRLMCDLSLDFETMSQRLQINFRKFFRPELESMADLEQDGLVRRSDTALEVTDLGRLLIRNIAARFDAYHSAGKEGTFSKTI